MEMNLAGKITQLRKNKGMTQDEVAERLGVSPQAVSKWETGVSCPDIMLVPKLSDLFEVSIDELFSRENRRDVVVLPEEERKNIDQMMLKVNILSSQGDKVRVNLPILLLKVGLDIGMKMPQMAGNEAFNQIDWDSTIEQIVLLVSKGVIGKLAEIESANGDIVEITVE